MVRQVKPFKADNYFILKFNNQHRPFEKIKIKDTQDLQRQELNQTYAVYILSG